MSRTRLGPVLLLLATACAGGSEIDLLGAGGSGDDGGTKSNYNAATATGNTAAGNTATGNAAPASQAATQAATTGAGAFCGDGACQAGETCANCPDDCTVGCAVCGDGTCAPTENSQNCPDDCGAMEVCGDGVCGVTEDEMTCPQDCMSMGLCDHDPCEAGFPLDPGCDVCVGFVCALDDYCCTVDWDFQCVLSAVGPCGC